LKLNIGDKVILQTFLGIKIPNDNNIDPQENYWKLVGCTGKVVEAKEKPHPAFPDKGLQLLVKFDNSILDLNLISHNNITNTLWIFETDLSLDNSATLLTNN